MAILLALTLFSCGDGNTPSAQSSTAPSLSVTPESSDISSSVPENEPSSEPNSESESEIVPEAESSLSDKILVAYFSRMGNMEFDENVDASTSASVNLQDGEYFGNAQLLAQMAQEITGGDLFFIETVEKYPSGYRDTTNQANDEKSADARPELASHVEDMDSYDTVILIYPNWWGGLPQATKTFLEEYDFSDKTIYPLCTHEGSGLSDTENDLAELCPGSVVLEGLSVRGGSAANSQEAVSEWLDGLAD